ncbi:hypothetical protein GALMADRAFT_141624 [Galerina marginata CBS 339.88]|uniref:DUF6534 domain-containing protein n=1 Tax=Galerina marginata (strain CBS 339.88) TaxID=685588 RepID=A0A067SSH7_GALM3|nr:hypothetical protein GALMADRAFT_141624 [Galerina marginata CBS 339.88]
MVAPTLSAVVCIRVQLRAVAQTLRMLAQALSAPAQALSAAAQVLRMVQLKHFATRDVAQTGSLTALFALADVIIFLLFPTTNVNFVFDLALSKFCTNSLLCTLNARSGWNGLTDSAGGTSANVLFGPMPSRMNTKHGFGNETTITTDVFEFQEIPDGTTTKTLESGIHVHKVVEHYSESGRFGASSRLPISLA